MGSIPHTLITMSNIWLSIMAWLCSNVKINLVDIYEWMQCLDGDKDGNITLGEIIDYIKRRSS